MIIHIALFAWKETVKPEEIDQPSLDAYRTHPDHTIVAEKIEKMEVKSLGVDFKE